MTPLIYLTSAWLLGIALARWLEPPPLLLALLAVPVLGGLFLYRQEPRPRFWALNALMGLLGAARLLLTVPSLDANHVAFYTDAGPVTLIARIVAEPDRRDTYTHLRVRAASITLPGGETRPVRGLVLVRAPRYPEYHYGDTLSILAPLETPPIFEGFSYREYLARQNIHAIARRSHIELLAEHSGFSLKAHILHLKARAHQVINRILPEPHAALLNGILLGIETGIPRDLYDDFNATGTSHIIVISGSNISLVVAILLLLGQKVFGKRYATIIATVGVVLYTIMVGADASVVRAAIMGGIYVGAIYFGRGNHTLNALFVAGLLMTLINPLTLWDVGFQLSFMATWGLIVLVPLLEGGAARFLGHALSAEQAGGVADLMNEALLVTIAAQIMTAPLTLYQFQRFSAVSLLANLLVVPVQPLVMIFGGLAAVAGLIFLPLGQIVGWLAWLPLAWTLTIVRWTARFSWAQLEIPGLPFWLLSLTYLTLGAAVWWLHQPAENWARTTLHGSDLRRSTAVTLGGLSLVAILVWSAAHNLPDGRLHVAFLDVGQGDAIFITTPNGRQVLIDGGPSSTQLTQGLGQQMPFWDHSLDLIVNTHPDMDHLGGLVEILGRYKVDTVLVSDAASTSAFYQEWNHRLEANGQAPILAWQGMALQLDEGVQALILNPGPASLPAEAPNNHSIVFKLTMGQISFLLPGDIEAEVERALVASSPLDLRATVLKSPHHGSKTSSSDAFLAAVAPQIVVVSVGKDNPFGHPSPEVLQRYIDHSLPILRTDEYGTLEFSTDGERLWVETKR